MTDTLRLTLHPVLNNDLKKKNKVTIFIDDLSITALEGESLAAALWANGILSLRHDEITCSERGMYCGIGHCYECRVTVDGVEDVRSCLTPVKEGMRVALKEERHEKGDCRDR